MNNFHNIKRLLVGSLMTAMALIPTTTSAAGYVTKVDKNGKITAVEEVEYFRDILKCGGVKAMLSLDGLNDQKPNIMAVLVETEGSKIYPKRLTSEFDDFIENYHTITNFEVGCLSGDGGIGIIFKSLDISNEDTYIQLDGSGRIFSNFNQTGFTLIPSDKSE